MRRLAALLLAGFGLIALADELPLTSATQLTEVPAAAAADRAYELDDQHLLTPAEGLGWLLVDKKSGESKHLMLPAFHPHHSRPALVGDQLAYVSLTKKGEQSQLGCITFDLVRGQVLNRRDTDLIAPPDGSPPGSIRIDEEGHHATCILSGEHCSGHEQTACRSAREEARKGLKGGKAQKGKGRGKGHHAGKSSRGKTPHGAKSTKKPVHPTSRSRTRKVHHS